MIEQGLMTEAGMAEIKKAKEASLWEKAYTWTGTTPEPPIPPEFKAALAKHKKAAAFFGGLAPSYRKHYLWWITAAKRPETKANRIKESIKLLSQGKKLPMK